VITRLRRAFGVLAPEQRLAGACAAGLFVTMFLPWYTRETTAVVSGRLQTVQSTLMAWKAFSFVEAAILLVAVGVLALLFARGERKAFHLPGGDGLVVAAAGAWVALLVFYRLIDNKTGATSEFQKVDYGVSWGIFVTLLCGIALAYTGQRLRQAHVAEPPLPGAGPDRDAETAVDRRARREARRPRPATETPPPPADGTDPPTAATSIARTTRPPRSADRPEIDGGTQLSFDEQE
jgi:hypothetical protein